MFHALLICHDNKFIFLQMFICLKKLNICLGMYFDMGSIHRSQTVQSTFYFSSFSSYFLLFKPLSFIVFIIDMPGENYLLRFFSETVDFCCVHYWYAIRSLYCLLQMRICLKKLLFLSMHLNMGSGGKSKTVQ